MRVPSAPDCCRRRPHLGWWALLLLAGSCLNPQPDPFPQASKSAGPSESGAANTVPVDAPPVMQPKNPIVTGTPAPAGGEGNGTAAAQSAPPPRANEAAPDAGAPADAGADAAPPDGAIAN